MYLVSNSWIFWGVILAVLIVAYLTKRFVPKEREKIIKVCNLIVQVCFYLIAIEVFYVVFTKILYSLD